MLTKLLLVGILVLLRGGGGGVLRWSQGQPGGSPVLTVMTSRTLCLHRKGRGPQINSGYNVLQVKRQSPPPHLPIFKGVLLSLLNLDLFAR